MSTAEKIKEWRVYIGAAVTLVAVIASGTFYLGEVNANLASLPEIKATVNDNSVGLREIRTILDKDDEDDEATFCRVNKLLDLLIDGAEVSATVINEGCP